VGSGNAALLIGYATVSRRLGRLNVSGAMFFTTAGLLAGPARLLDLQVHGEQVKLLAKITLTLVLFADASRISLRALRHESRGAGAALSSANPDRLAPVMTASALDSTARALRRFGRRQRVCACVPFRVPQPLQTPV
jgi:Kef-type K+ transport system membrane component KefB